MNINPRKPLHASNNITDQPDEDAREEVQNNSNDTDEQTSTESGSDFYDDEDDTTYSSRTEYRRQEAFEISSSVPRTPTRPKGRAATRSPSLKPFINESNKPAKPMPQESPKNSSFKTTLAIFAIAIIVGACSIRSPTIKHCSYEKLQKLYPQQEEDLWSTLKVGIELILNGQTHSPAVYLFVHHGGQHVFQLVKDIARHSSECFGPQMRPIEIESDDFIATTSELDKDYGYAIEKYRSKIKEGNVFLIANLNEIPAEAARALHTICDTYSPIAENVVIFLTLTIAPIVEGNVVSNAENTLIELWSPKLDRNELDPLITRVTDQVIALRN